MTIYSTISPDGTIRWSSNPEELAKVADELFHPRRGEPPDKTCKARVAFWTEYMGWPMYSSCRGLGRFVTGGSLTSMADVEMTDGSVQGILIRWLDDDGDGSPDDPIEYAQTLRGGL